MKLSHMTSLNVMLHVVVAVYRLGKIWNSPQLPAQFRNGLRPKHPPLLVCLSVVRRHKHPHDPQSYAGWSVTLLTGPNIQDWSVGERSVLTLPRPSRLDG